jgi:putative ATPase
MTTSSAPHRPLAARMRPLTLDEIVGQGHLLGDGSALRRAAEADSSSSVILWGPPGTGKTTIASVIARSTSQRFDELSATSAGVKEVRTALANAQKARDSDSVSTLLFIDEIHRFSKTQQDVLLPAVENRTITLVGATTENPSFSVNSALLSRSLLLTLRPLMPDDVVFLLERAVVDPRGLDSTITLGERAAAALADLAGGDARRALTYLEEAAASAVAQHLTEITVDVVAAAVDRAIARYDQNGDQHYDIISAFIKSMRGSDPQGTLHWLARMIEAGEDPRFIARRIVVHASEDVGMADPTVLPVAVAAAHAVQFIGMPEARINLAQAALAVATAAKSPAVMGIDDAIADVRAGRTGEVPMHLRDAHYPGAKALGHGAGYLFPHDFPYGIVAQQYLPDETLGRRYYAPTDNGFEHVIGTRMDAIERLNNDKRA